MLAVVTCAVRTQLAAVGLPADEVARDTPAIVATVVTVGLGPRRARTRAVALALAEGSIRSPGRAAAPAAADR